jgi:hypothetical protein
MSLAWLVYPFLSIVAAFGVLLIVGTLVSVRKSRATLHWPSAQATLLDSGVEGGKRYDEEKVIYLRYTYTIGGNSYTGWRIRPHHSVDDSEGEELLARLRRCKVFLVRYNPSNPEVAYVLPGAFRDEWAAFYAGMLFLVAAILFMLVFHFLTAGTVDYASAVTILE